MLFHDMSKQFDGLISLDSLNKNKRTKVIKGLLEISQRSLKYQNKEVEHMVHANLLDKFKVILGEAINIFYH